ncbi:MAG: PEGA domain-containing protein [Methanoregula sp.]
MSHTSSTNLLRILTVACLAVLLVPPAHAFTANSLDITIDKSGDATASFKFTLEGFLENAIPQSMMEEELKKGLTTSSEPPVLLSMDKTGAIMILKKFADTRDVATGTEYRTASMNFQKAEIALKESALSSVVTADFTPAKITITFPDAYTRSFANSAVLPSLTHIVIDPSKSSASTTQDQTGGINVTASPSEVQVSIDGTYVGDTPGTFSDIPAGTHTLLFQKDGFQPVTKTVAIVAGKTTNVFVFLQYTPQTTTAPQGILPVPGFGLLITGLAVSGCIMLRKIVR